MSKKKVKFTMVGKFFHSIEDGCLKWQGRIIGEPKKGLFMVQCYDWIMGEAQDQELVSIDEMKNWIFYNSHESMNYSYEYGSARRFSSQFKLEQEELKKNQVL